MDNLTLYQIADQYMQDMQRLQDLDLDEQTIADTLEGMAGALEEKVTNVAMFVRNVEASVEAIKAAEKQMYERRKALENRSERIRKYMLENMQRTGISKIECPFFKVSVKNNPESLVIEPDAVIPDSYYIEPPPPQKVLDKAALKEDMKMGVIVEGCRLERKQRVDIK